ncbi:Nucleoporin SEH1 [Cricetulus griseus]|uniref:Nucleoporin SEH1 n=1 Tax=Cricetulus griseus TaxID=10029 RepID=G3INH6_CRIGR|nr:Nucleoporin SEH1 [Cricetulus griseus]
MDLLANVRLCSPVKGGYNSSSITIQSSNVGIAVGSAVWEESNECSRRIKYIAEDHEVLMHDMSFDFLGCRMATCSSDQSINVWNKSESRDWHCTAIMNLSQWSLQHEISCKLSCSCISWNPSISPAHYPMIAVGSNDSSRKAMTKFQIFEYNENTKKCAKAEILMTVTDPVHDIAFAPNSGRSFHILAIATKDVRIFTLHL